MAARVLVAVAATGVASAPVAASAPAVQKGQAAQAESGAFDVVLLGGRVLDGTGNPWFKADVGIRDGTIARVGDLAGAEAVRVVDVSGLYVVPGFIDIHSHADGGLDAEGPPGSDGARRRAAPNLVAQGVTTVVVNQDGGGAWPIAAQRQWLEDRGHGPNAILMAGHNVIRGLVLGADHRRPATDAEVGRMTTMVERAMEEGAYGLSAGLEYVPGRWSETEELLPLVSAAGAGGGVFIVHERSSGMTPMWFWPSQDEPGAPTMIHTILEDIEIAERTGVTTVATHIKARGADFWGTGRTLIQLIETARERGVPIWADQYPYPTTGTDGNTVLIPSWVFASPDTTESPRDRLLAALADPDRGELVRQDIDHEINRRGGPANLLIMDHPDSALVGVTLADLISEWGANPVDAAIRLQLDGDPDRRGGARIRGFSLSEIDVALFAAEPWTITASDAGIALPGDGPVHARFYGTFPRKIRRYAMEQEVLSVESAIRSATSLPAQVLGLRDRGQVREGYRADLTVIDLASIQDRATFFEPHQYPDGVEHVLVAGEFVVDGGELTWALPGTVITPDSARAR